MDALATSGLAGAATEAIGETSMATRQAADTSGAALRRSEADVAAVRNALHGDRIDLYLQPIVSLPQRKVRYYEALSRMRTQQGDVLSADEFIEEAERGGLMPAIDGLVARRCVQIARRLLSKNREIGLFCNISAATLAEPSSCANFLDLMQANRALAHSLILEFTLAAVRRMGAAQHEALSALSKHGFRFSVDNVTDLRLEPADLASRGFRFVKTPAALLVKRSPPQIGGIAPAELSDLLGRFGIDLIADRIELEASVIDLIDCDVRYGQGFLFSAPRPVRAEALQPLSEGGPAEMESSPALTAAGTPAENEATGQERLAALVRETANGG
jgi:cyclic-di-GMP phosphodiesterase TipF (flagellum assembly factor)